MNVVFSGRMGAGKDYCAEQAGLTIMGLMDPLYPICKQFFGTDDKSLPGMRRFMQTVGVWGRGIVNEEYPLNPERALLLREIRMMGCDGHTPLPFSCEWLPQLCYMEKFGTTQRFWLDMLLHRVKGKDRVAIVNARFPDEISTFKGIGFQHFHVVCKKDTLAVRGRTRGLAEGANDLTEQMALGFDREFFEGKYTGDVIWNDVGMPQMSPGKVYSVNAFFNITKGSMSVGAWV